MCQNYFSYKDSLFILTTTRKEDFKINSTFRSDFLVYLGLFNGDKSDSSIFRMVIFGFVLILLFSSQSLGYYYLFGSIVSGHRISPPKGVHQGLFKSRVIINKGITRHVSQTIQINKTSCLPHFVCVCVCWGDNLPSMVL